jgi:hypothetical protein
VGEQKFGPVAAPRDSIAAVGATVDEPRLDNCPCRDRPFELYSRFNDPPGLNQRCARFTDSILD